MYYKMFEFVLFSINKQDGIAFIENIFLTIKSYLLKIKKNRLAPSGLNLVYLKIQS